MDEPAGLGLVVEPQLGASQLERQRDQARLVAIVQVPLDVPQLGRLGIDGLAAGAGEQVDPRPERPSTQGDQHPVVQRVQG